MPPSPSENTCFTIHPTSPTFCRPSGNCPAEGAVVPPVVAEPQKVTVWSLDGVDHAVAAGEDVLDVPPVPTFCPALWGAAQLKVPSSSPFVAKPQQVTVWAVDRVNHAVAAGEHVLEVPPVADLLALASRPAEGAVYRALRGRTTAGHPLGG